MRVLVGSCVRVHTLLEVVSTLVDLAGVGKIPRRSLDPNYLTAPQGMDACFFTIRQQSEINAETILLLETGIGRTTLI